MFRFIATTLYPNFPASYRSDYPLNEAVGRLRGSVETNGFYALLKESAVGKVSERHVRLQRVIPFFGNSFKPIFVGMFRQKAEGVFLEGKFTTFMYSKIFMTLWFGFASLWTFLATAYAIFAAVAMVIKPSVASAQDNLFRVLPFPFFGLLFIALGYGMVRFSWWLSRGDIDFLSRTILGALTK